MKEYTELELSEFFDTIIEGTLAGFWDWDIKNNKEYLSPKFKQVLGYKDHEMENSPDAWKAVIFREDLLEVLKNFEDHIASKGQIPYHNEVRYHHKKGTTVHIICSGKVVEWDDKGNALRMIGVHVDVTDLRRAQTAERVKEDFLKIMSHELRTPLNGIMGMTQLLLSEQDIIQNYSKELEVILESGKELLSRIEDILSISEESLDVFSEFNFRELLLSILKTYERSTKSKNINIEINFSQHLPELIVTSPLRIKQVLNNLINNAVKFTENGTIIFDSHFDGDSLIFSIQDSGIGINKELLEEIFEVFSSLDTRIDRTNKGVGIGLSICKKICQDLGGCITVESEQGQGSKFIIEIPVFTI